jgi:hypothetical protein
MNAVRICNNFFQRRNFKKPTSKQKTVKAKNQMKPKTFLIPVLSLFASYLYAQSPVITSWKINTTGATILNGTTPIIVDVEAVYYDSNEVYVKTSGVPDYYNFTNNNGNVNAASDLKAVFKITRTPQQNTGTPFSTLGGGQYGLYKDGTLLFNGEDARSYKNQNIWHSLAYYFEYMDFDNTWGHSTPTKQYHHHVLDLAMQDTTKSMVHSPIIGFAFDGYPVYGPFAHKNPMDASSKIVRVTTSYQKRNITDRTSLPDGTLLSSTQYGPALGGSYPLGCYREDYTYVAGSGMLDEHNGMFTKTPEYPNGTYAYFCTLDSTLRPQYPYCLGQSMYGVPTQGNFGPMGGQNTIPQAAVKYMKSAIEQPVIDQQFSFFPNPAANIIHINLPGTDQTEWLLEISDLSGNTIWKGKETGNTVDINISSLNQGMYFLKTSCNSSKAPWISRLVKN